MSDLAGELHQLLGAKRDLARDASAAPVTLAELGVLRAIEVHGPCGLGRLAVETGVDTSVVSRQVSALVAAGLVERTVDPHDGRSHPVRTTLEGKAALEQSRGAVLARWERALTRWTDDDLEHLAATLRRLRLDLRPGCAAGRPAGVVTPSSATGTGPSPSSTPTDLTSDTPIDLTSETPIDLTSDSPTTTRTPSRRTDPVRSTSTA